MTRPTGWPELLAEYVQEHALEPMVWGKQDCAQFALRWIRLMGVEIPFEIPEYSTAREAIRILRNLSGDEQDDESFSNLIGVVSKILGPYNEFPQSAGRGDIAIVIMNERPALGIVLGSDVVGPGAQSLIMCSRKRIVHSWKVA